MLIRRLFTSTPFSKLEVAVLKALESALSPECGQLLQDQLSEISRVTRLSRCREVLFYPRDTKDRSSEPFPDRRKEVKCATIRFSVAGTSNVWRADYYLVKGYLFSINFTPGVEDVRKSTGIVTHDIQILSDPCRPSKVSRSSPTNSAPDNRAFPVWFEQLRERTHVVNASPPLPEPLRKEALLALDTTFPADYLELVEAADGVALEGLSIVGLSEVYEIAMPDATYYAVAEVDAIGQLAVMAGGRDRQLYFLEYEGAPPWSNYGRSLARAITRVRSERLKGTS